MSKKTKGSSAKKSIKKVAKPLKKSSAKKIAVKKPTAKKKIAVKKPVKKIIAKKAVKAATKPKVAAKKIAKNALPTKSATKKIITKPVKVEKVQALKKETITKPVKAEIKKPEVKIAVKKEVISAPSPIKASLAPKTTEKPVETSSKKTGDAKPQSNEVLAISNTIPKPKVSLISASKIASISSSITNPIKKVDSYSIKSEKEPNGKYEMEIVVRSSPEMLYEFLSTPSGLSEWFCDDVNIRNGIYTFIWEGQLQQARLLKTVDDHLVRFQWVDKIDGSYFEFKIQRDDLTNDISLIVTDFAETVSERESSKLLWHSQVEKLLHIMGSI